MKSFTIAGLANSLRQKKISAHEIAKETVDRYKNDPSNSVIRLNEEKLFEQAVAADKLGYSNNAPWLRGIPLGIKDNIVTTDTQTTCASKILEGYQSTYNADVVNRLALAGALMANKLNMDEFAMGSTGEYSQFGAVLNPCNKDYVAGGSSAGSAAALKAGIFAGTLGSDTGGSVRLPAAFCGVLGLKPTYGLVSRYGLVAFGSSLDQIGPLAHTVDDLAAILEAVAGRPKDKDSFYWEQDSTLSPVQNQPYRQALVTAANKKLNIGVLDLESLSKQSVVNDEIENRQNELISFLTKKGHKVSKVAIPSIQYSVAVYYIIAVCEASTNLARFDGVRYGKRCSSGNLEEHYTKTRGQFGAEVKRRILLGTFALSAGYYDAYYKKACQVRRIIKNDFINTLNSHDLILSPVSATTALRCGASTDPLQTYLNDLFTIPANLAGLPALSIPVGRDKNSMPIGAQIVGRPFDEVTLLSVAQSIQTEFYKEAEVENAI